MPRFALKFGFALALLALSAGALPNGALSTAALAQNYDFDHGRYQNQLTRLSEILGQLHHVRGACVSGEQQLWRDNMMELIRLEEPPTERKNAMVARFNAAYEEARRAYPDCGRETSERATALAREGAQISEGLSKNLGG